MLTPLNVSGTKFTAQGYEFAVPDKFEYSIRFNACICNRLLLNILQVISQKYGLNL